ncbi:MAG: hypothetical protein ABIZ70_10430, partial [Gemmatimonadales bacterium]
PFAGMFSFPWLLTRFFLPGAIIGFAGGAIYAAAIALTPRAVGDQSLSGKRAAAFGALGGIVVFIAIRLTLLSDSTAGLMVVPTLVFAGLGAATGLGILGTAKRAALRPGEEPPNSIAP